jgi:hypothetical protein
METLGRKLCFQTFIKLNSILSVYMKEVEVRIDERNLQIRKYFIVRRCKRLFKIYIRKKGLTLYDRNLIQIQAYAFKLLTIV